MFPLSIRQQLHQPFVDEEDFLAGFDFGHEAGGGEVVEVAGGGDAVAEAGFLEMADFAVGADQELLDEFPSVPSSSLGPHFWAKLHFARMACLRAERAPIPTRRHPRPAKCNFAPKRVPKLELRHEVKNLRPCGAIQSFRTGLIDARQPSDSG